MVCNKLKVPVDFIELAVESVVNIKDGRIQTEKIQDETALPMHTLAPTDLLELRVVILRAEVVADKLRAS